MFILLEELDLSNPSRPIPRLVNHLNIEWIGHSQRLKGRSVRMTSGHEFRLATDNLTLWRVLQRAGSGIVTNARLESLSAPSEYDTLAMLDYDDSAPSDDDE